MTGFDAGVIAITLISGLLAMIRGFVREILSILAWVTAAVAAIASLPYVAPVARQMLEPAWLAESIAAFTIFAVVLVAGSILTFRLGERVPEGHVGTLDRTGGFLFGLARGLLLVTVAYIFVAWLVPRQEFPRWMADARLLPVVSATAETLAGWVGNDAGEAARGPRATIGTQPDTAEDPPADRSPGADSGDLEGYNAEERRRLDQLFQSVGPNGGQ